MWQHVKLTDVSLGNCPRYSLVADEGAKKPTKPNCKIAILCGVRVKKKPINYLFTTITSLQVISLSKFTFVDNRCGVRLDLILSYSVLCANEESKVLCVLLVVYLTISFCHSLIKKLNQIMRSEIFLSDGYTNKNVERIMPTMITLTGFFFLSTVYKKSV